MKNISQQSALPPLSASTIRKLMFDLHHLKETADRKKVSINPYEEQEEFLAGQENFELGCWLHYFSRRVSHQGKKGLSARIQCARKLFEKEVFRPGYKFFTVFDFGERHFDTIFEMGDSQEVIAGLRKLIPTDSSGNLVKAFNYFGWPIHG